MSKHIDINSLNPDSPEAVSIARHVTWVGFWINAALGVAKVLAGIFGRSSALIADGIHSFSDFLSDIIVIVMVGISRKRPDTDHQFGHGHYEAFATILLSVVLAVVAVGIFYDSVERMIAVANGEVLPRPGMITLIIIVVSILSKEWLFHYTKRVGESIGSQAVVANAWHHRSDSLSSIATLIGVGGAMFLGEGARILDPIAAAVVGVFIAVVSVKLCMPAINELLGASLPEDTCKMIEKAIDETPGVIRHEKLRTFKSGHEAYIEVQIIVHPDITICKAHDIATQAEKNIAAAVTSYTAHVITHIEPDDEAVCHPLTKVEA